jgi:tetratricopeptide (TPR) repeat protein
MIKLRKIPLLLLSLLFLQTTQAAGPIQLEVKVFGNDVIFVFYHDTDKIIDLSNNGNKVTARINVPTEFNILNPNEFNKYAGNINIGKNNQSIVFETKGELKYQKNINGEKLYAIQFKSVKAKPKKDDLSTIGSTSNNPGVIKYSKKNKEHLLSFNVGKNNSKVAVFFKGKYLWVAFNQKKNFSFKKNNIFNQFELIPSEQGTIMRFLVKPGFAHANVVKHSLGWTISVAEDVNEQQLTPNILSPEPLSGYEGFLIRGEFQGHELISFEDPELGHTITLLPMASRSRIDMQKESIEFSVLKSVQGVVISLFGDDAKVEKYNNAIKILSNTFLPDSTDSGMYSYSSRNIKELTLPGLLPYLDKKLNILNFNRQKARLISEASLSRDNKEGFLRNLALARFYFNHQWYHESLGALELAKRYSFEDYQNSLQARFLMAVNYTMIGEFEQAKEEYDSLLAYDDLRQVAEINLWNKYNQFALGSNSVTSPIGFINLITKSVALYSDDKYWALAFAEIELALLANDLKLVDRIFKEVRIPSKHKYANSLKYYKAGYYRKKDQLHLAKQYYSELTHQKTDLLNKVRAEFELTKIKVDLGDIKVSEGIKILERLRFMWRGDQLEYKILFQLAKYYREIDDMLNALRTFSYMQ